MLRRRVPLLALAFIVLSGLGFAVAYAGEFDRLTSTPIHLGGRPSGAPPLAKDGAGLYPDAMPRYHNGIGVVCQDCHVMHASQSHLYAEGAPRPGEAVPYTGGANPKLLKAPDALDLCLSCHDGQAGIPDVVAGDANALTLRSAGHFDQPDVQNPRGHDLGRGLSTGDWEMCYRCHFSTPLNQKVTCVDCHNPHGNNVARNLQWASYPEGTPDLALLVNPAATGMQRYEAQNVSYGTLNSDALREVSNMCLDCHHIFSGVSYIDPDGNGIHNRHPTYDSERGSPNTVSQGEAKGTTSGAHWDAGTGSGFTTPRLRFVASGASDFATAQVVDADNNGVFCLSCHQAHGSEQAFSAAWPLDGGYSAPGCDQCHAVAGN